MGDKIRRLDMDTQLSTEPHRVVILPFFFFLPDSGGNCREERDLLGCVFKSAQMRSVR